MERKRRASFSNSGAGVGAPCTGERKHHSQHASWVQEDSEPTTGRWKMASDVPRGVWLGGASTNLARNVNMGFDSSVTDSDPAQCKNSSWTASGSDNPILLSQALNYLWYNALSLDAIRKHKSENMELSVKTFADERLCIHTHKLILPRV